jgi:hypothetical protein
VRNRLLLFVLSVLLLGTSAFGQQSSGSNQPPPSSSTASNENSTKTVHVRSYTRKDGTVVRAYDRSVPATKGTTTPSPPNPVAAAPKAGPEQRDSRGRIKRSAAARDEFERETGYSHGRNGYVVDHIVPLACGGADSPRNMQWQTVAEAKAKDKTERIGCK